MGVSSGAQVGIVFGVIFALLLLCLGGTYLILVYLNWKEVRKDFIGHGLEGRKIEVLGMVAKDTWRQLNKEKKEEGDGRLGDGS